MRVNISRVEKDKKQYLELLLLADEQESMIDRYLQKGDMYALADPDVKGVCVVSDNGGGEYEIKNIAVVPSAQGSGYGKAMVEFVKRAYGEKCSRILVGTGDSPLTLPFYQKCGFKKAFIKKNFFLDNYDHPIIEGGVQLVDMVYLTWTPDAGAGQAKRAETPTE